MTARLELRGVARRYGETVALHGVDLCVEAGEYCVLLGPSGCGKTTLLNILGGFVDPTAGAVLIGGRDMTRTPPEKRPTTTVFQDYALFPHMSLRDNVAFGLRMRGVGRGPRHARAEAMLDLVGLPGAGARRPAALSGGQRQRVALARALAVEPDVLLLDEPLGALDLNLRRAMQAELKAIQRRVGATFVHVTHDQEEAMAIADRIVVMNAGRIEDEGPPERVYRRPRTRFAAAFLGETTFLEAVARGGAFDTPLGPLALPHPAPEGARVTLSLRPEHVGVGDGLSLGRGEVIETVFQGVHRRVRCAMAAAPGVELLALLPVGADAQVGDVLDLTLDAPHVAVLTED
ncbi:MAG: ABC transporter ATP-binding protein [Rhodobacteraceae bacterium]|nr:MAG: ABC transporter ATP-binding protein [Paracoccaceae bacterium]